MKKLGNLLCTAIALIAMTSCGAFKSYVADYSIGLKTVESPANAKQQFGDTKVVNFQDGTTNKSGHTLKINWDDISYVDYKGQTGRVMHSGVKYNERNNSQPASTVPKGASLSDLLLPTDNVYFVSGQYGGWREKYLIPCVYNDAATRDAQASSYVGKTMTIMMPIMIENVQNDYTFTFSIDKLLNNSK